MAGQLSSSMLLAVPLAPLAGSAIAGLLGTKFLGNVVGRKVSHTATILGVLIALIISVQTLMAVLDGVLADCGLDARTLAADHRGLSLEVAGWPLDIGIRVEDDAVITPTGCELISREVPVAVAEIEALMRG